MQPKPLELLLPHNSLYSKEYCCVPNFWVICIKSWRVASEQGHVLLLPDWADHRPFPPRSSEPTRAQLQSYRVLVKRSHMVGSTLASSCVPFISVPPPLALTAQKSQLCHNNAVIGSLWEGEEVGVRRSRSRRGKGEGLSGGRGVSSRPRHSAGRWTTKSLDSFVGYKARKKNICRRSPR